MKAIPTVSVKDGATSVEPAAEGMERRRQPGERQGKEQQLDFVIRSGVEGEREVVSESLHSQ